MKKNIIKPQRSVLISKKLIKLCKNTYQSLIYVLITKKCRGKKPAGIVPVSSYPDFFAVISGMKRRLFNVYRRTRSFSGIYKKPTVRNGAVYSRLLGVFVVTVSVRRSGLSCRNVSADATGQHI